MPLQFIFNKFKSKVGKSSEEQPFNNLNQSSSETQTRPEDSSGKEFPSYERCNQPSSHKTKRVCSWIKCLFLAYMAAWVGCVVLLVILREEDYTVSEQIERVVSIKVYGTVLSNFSEDQFKEFVTSSDRQTYNRLWDPEDYVLPHANGQSNEVFITTNFIIRKNQTRSKCPEDPYIPHALCNPNDTQACQFEGSLEGNGVRTGRCVPTTFRNGNNTFTCEIKAWCPVIRERDFPLKDDTSLLRQVNHSKVFISTAVRFPKFKFTPLPERRFRNYKTCDVSDSRCPPFHLENIVQEAHQWNATKAEKVYKYGGVLALHVHWTDCVVGKECNPTYTAVEFADPNLDTFEHHTILDHDLFDPSLNQRTDIKAYGVRLIVLVSGTAKQWSLFAFLTSCAKYGSLLSLATTLLKLYKCKKDDNSSDHNTTEEDEQNNLQHADCPDGCAKAFSSLSLFNICKR